MASKSNEAAFTSDWEKAVAWSQSENIGNPAIQAVYQYDAQRVSQGDYPMSAAERNRALLAANNPNDVTPAPSDVPRPSNVINNAKRDVTMIGTGLSPTHLIGGLFDMAKNTVEDVLDPKRIEGKNLESTVGNFLSDTALSLVPGASDVGKFLQAGGGEKGLAQLADDPLLSLLDVFPFGKAAEAGLSSEVAGRIASRAGMDLARYQGKGAMGGLGLLLGQIPTSKVGLTMVDGVAQIRKLSLGQAIDSISRNSRLGTSTSIADLSEAYNTASQSWSNVEAYTFAPAAKAFSALDDTQKAKVLSIFQEAATKGQPIQKLIADANDPGISEAVSKLLGEPLRLQTDKLIASGENVPVHVYATGRDEIYTAGQHEAVLNARETLKKAQQMAMHGDSNGEGGIQELAQLADTDNKLVQMSQPLTQGLTQANSAARQLVGQPDAITGNLVSKELGTSISKKTQAQALFREGGMVDNLLNRLQEGDPDQVFAAASVVSNRLKSWGVESVQAEGTKAFEDVAASVDKVKQWAKIRKDIAKKANTGIEGARAANVFERREALADLRQARETLEGRQKDERAGLRESHRSDLAKINALRNKKMADLDQTAQQAADLSAQRAGQAAQRATPQFGEDLAKRGRVDAYKAKISARDAKRLYNRDFDDKLRIAREGHTKQRAELEKRQANERREMAMQHEGRRVLIGRISKAVNTYAKALRDFEKAVWDHPSDVWRDAWMNSYMRHLAEHDSTRSILDRTLSDSQKKALMKAADSQQLLDEMTFMSFRDLYNDPNLDPDLAETVAQTRQEVTKSANDEIATLRAQGRLPQYIPAADSFDATKDDMTRSGISIPIGRGIPKVDAVAKKVWDLTPVRHEVALGVSKGLRQVLTRDAMIDFAETHLSARMLNESQVAEAINTYFPQESADVINRPDYLQSAAAKHLNLVRFNPKDHLGITLPRWTGKGEMYMDRGMAEALDKLANDRYKTGVWDKTNKVFRYSVLGLSPRYTAHVLFGGGFMLAARSTPYLPTMLSAAWQGIRDGTLPMELKRTSTEEGMLDVALNAHAKAGGKALANTAIFDHIENVQGIAAQAAKPVHFLKAIADVNYRFTNKVRHMMSALAYLDGAAKASRTIIDPETGEHIAMTSERAMAEGMHHVTEVFGNLHRETPLSRQISRSILPFYGWTKHILSYVLTMPIDHPWRAQVLSELAWQNTNDVPLGLPQRIQFLYFFGAPDSQGNATAADLRFMDPFRDIGTYGHLTGWIEGLNPIFMAPAMMVDPQATYGSNELYPTLNYDPQYGIETAGLQGSLASAVEQIVPQVGAVADAVDAATQSRSLASTDRSAWVKNIFESLNIPFVPQSVNVKQVAAKDEDARYNAAKSAATNAFEATGMQGTGIQQALSGYSSVPNPLNPDYEITPEQLQSIYNAALAQYPGQNPSSVLVAPPTPAGF